MRQIEVPDRPRRLVFGLVTLALAKKYQFEPEPFTIRSRHITRVVPPFGAKIFVFEVVLRKLLAITWQRLAIGESTRQQRENKQRKREWLQAPAYFVHLVTMRYPAWSLLPSVHDSTSLRSIPAPLFLPSRSPMKRTAA